MCFVADNLLFQSLLPLFSSAMSFKWIYWAISFLTIAGFIWPFFLMARNPEVRSPLTNFMIGLAFSIIVTKILYMPLMLLGKGIAALLSMSAAPFLLGAFGIALVFFLFMLYGISLGKYQYKVSNVPLAIPDLPAAFEGFKIAQISDIHSGTFDSIKAVEKGVKMVNEQKADIIVFTGDLVNQQAKEIEPYYKVFSQLKAPEGVYSVLGNHDYYQFRWTQDTAAHNYLFYREQHQKTGFQLLLNENIVFEKEGAKLALIGVENWGEPPFPQLGDLDLAVEGTEDCDVRILLSHDPTHWKNEVIDHPEHIHLTLSGHTHAMQFGFNIFGFKWSPVKYRYKEWWGLYEKMGRYLYVNRGFGFLGFPGRVGMPPEISVFELKQE